LVFEAFVVIVNRDREHLLGVVLADHIVVKNFAKFLRRWDAVARLRRGLGILVDDVLAQLDALVADEDRRSGNALAHLVLVLAAERAAKRVLRAPADFIHRLDLSRIALLEGVRFGSW